MSEPTASPLPAPQPGPAPASRVRVWHICPPVSAEAIVDAVIVSSADADRWVCTEIHSGAPIL